MEEIGVRCSRLEIAMNDSRRLKTIPRLENPKRSHRRAGTIRHQRQESNEAIMHEAMLYHGRVRLNITIRILHPHTRTYAGWHGSAVTVDAPSISTAKDLRGKIHDAISSISRELGLSLLYQYGR